MPILFLLLGIVAIAAFASSSQTAPHPPNVPLGPTPPGSGGFVCPSNGHDDIGDLPDPFERTSVCTAFYTGIDPAKLLTLADHLDTAGFHTAAARIRNRAVLLTPAPSPLPLPAPGPSPSPSPSPSPLTPTPSPLSPVTPISPTPFGPTPPPSAPVSDDIDGLPDGAVKKGLLWLMANPVTPSTPAAWLTSSTYGPLAQLAAGIDPPYHTAAEKLKSWLKTARPDWFSNFFYDDWKPKPTVIPSTVFPAGIPVP